MGLELGAERLILNSPPDGSPLPSASAIGTVGLLLAAKDRGFLAKLKPELDRLLAVRFFMGQELDDRAIDQAGE